MFYTRSLTIFALWTMLLTALTLLALPRTVLGNEEEHAAHAAIEPGAEAALVEAAAEGAKSEHTTAVKSVHAQPAAPTKSSGSLATWWAQAEEKFGRLQTLDEDNEILRSRGAVLELENARLANDHAGCAEVRRAEKLKMQAKAEGGVEHSRTIASLKTSDAKLLSRAPKNIYEAALKAFSHNDYETAAKAFIFLSDTPEHEVYQNAPTFFLAGVSLFKVGNFKRANDFFALVVKTAQKTEAKADVSYAPRALAWMALAYSKLGEKAHAEFLIQELMQKYPQSKEARKLNRRSDV